LKYISGGELVGKWTIGGFNPKVNLPADVFESGVAHQGAGQQAGFSQNLKPVANAEHQPAAGRKALNCLHYRRKTRNCPGAQVVAVGKSAGYQNRIHSGKIFRVMPKKRDWLFGHLGNYVESIMVAIGTGKDQDTKFHECRVTVSMAGGGYHFDPAD
jgi:hypothetical protein